MKTFVTGNYPAYDKESHPSRNNDSMTTNGQKGVKYNTAWHISVARMAVT
jgi:hypothetical protein